MADEERATRIAGESNGHAASTLASLFLRAMRKHDRPAVLLHKEESRWRETRSMSGAPGAKERNQRSMTS